ncbi:hypothetical protein H5410_041514 [Solanum commersonii]|uniref:Uncharacterized protein n=1 Tax=Solanum commersonii TaxID=4109 RepID=A0A9J5XUZ1_SOLCO|nr:hypothetical protein H5410_041514 [Solanum commersonii]
MHQWNLIFEIRRVSFLFRSLPVRARSIISKLMCAFSYHYLESFRQQSCCQILLTKLFGTEEANTSFMQ